VTETFELGVKRLVLLREARVVIKLFAHFNIGFLSGFEALFQVLAVGFPCNSAKVRGLEIQVEHREAGVRDKHLSDVR
jgi:hypothetical protein